MPRESAEWFTEPPVSERSIICLLIEDNPDHTELVEKLLHAAFPHLRLLTAHTYSEGLQDFHQESCHLALVNAQVGGQFDEIGISDFLHVVAPVPVIVLTEQVEKSLAAKIVAAGAAYCCPKNQATLRQLPTLIDRLTRQNKKPIASGLPFTTTQSITALTGAIERQLGQIPAKLRNAHSVRTELALLQKELALLRAVLGSLVPAKLI